MRTSSEHKAKELAMKPIIFATLFAITTATSGYAGVMPEEETFLIENVAVEEVTVTTEEPSEVNEFLQFIFTALLVLL